MTYPFRRIDQSSPSIILYGWDPAELDVQAVGEGEGHFANFALFSDPLRKEPRRHSPKKSRQKSTGSEKTKKRRKTSQ